MKSYAQPTESSSRKSKNSGVKRVDVQLPARVNNHNRPESPIYKPKVQPQNTLHYNIINHDKTFINYKNLQSKLFKVDKENRPPSNQKSPSPPRARYPQNQYSNQRYCSPPKSRIPFVVKEKYPSPPKKSSQDHYVQNNSQFPPIIPQSRKRPVSSDHSDKDKKPVHSPRKPVIVSHQESILKEINSNVDRGRNQIRNQDIVKNSLQYPTHTVQNQDFMQKQIPRRGNSSENRSTWQIDNQARTEKIVGIRNFSNTCFAGSLLQCLYHLPTFKECLYKCTKDHPSDLIRLFEELFRSMDRVDVDKVNSSALKLIFEIFRIRSHEFKLGVQGSSEILFRGIIEEFGASSPLVQLFWKGRYSKIVECQKCYHPMKITEDIFILHAKDIDYKPERADDGSLFQPRNELRKCRECQVQTSHSTSYEFESLPNVLAIAISDTVDTRSSNKLIPNISVQIKDEKTVQYEYFASIVNMIKGSAGVHSIAIVKSNENEGGGYFELNDSIARRLSSLDSVYLYPKLIFYQRINFPSPHKPDTPPPTSTNPMNFYQRVNFPSPHKLDTPPPALTNSMFYHQKTQPVKAFPLQEEEKKEQEMMKAIPKETSEIIERGRQMTQSGDTQRRGASRSPFTQEGNPFRSEFGRRIPLENKDRTSFAGALLQCLYHLPKFKSNLFQYKGDHQGKIHKIADLLANFFDLMDTTDAQSANEAACKFFEFMIQNRWAKKGVHGDSVKLWNMIYGELIPRGSTATTLPFLSLFAAKSEVITTCIRCSYVQTPLQNFTSLTLDEEEYARIDGGILMRCRCPYQSYAYQRAEIVFATFPEILVISIIPSARMYQSESKKLLPKITLKGSNNTRQDYEYHAGILTLSQYHDGAHSIAIIQCSGSKGSYYAFDDNLFTKANLQNISYFPRLLFYRKSSE